ncbi:MAG: hypothetical protein M1819_006934 [Sarea resinae]|nr:MAG: hypothetical protein M1819_006934 [Sarea resinae]
MADEVNTNGVALVLTLARYFKRWSLWSKDIIILVAGDSRAGPQAWVDAYHNVHSPDSIESLPLKSGALQGAVVVDYPFTHGFQSIHVVYDGVNGQLPNLDLFNTAVSIATGQMGIGATLQQMWKHSDCYKDRLQTMLRGMLSQGLGHASGPHSSFIPYHVDAITLQAVGEGWHDEMSMGRSIESIFRSLNNLLEHFHQSFFFYLLMQANRFVSIGTYLPSAMLVAVNFTIMAIALWIQSGRPTTPNIASTKSADSLEDKTHVVHLDELAAVVPAESLTISERKLFLPLTLVIGIHFLGFIPLHIFNHSSIKNNTAIFFAFMGFNFCLPYLIAACLIRYFQPSRQHYLLIKSFSLLLLGMFLSALATLNFSLSILVGLLSAPLVFARPLFRWAYVGVTSSVLLQLIAPTTIALAACSYWGLLLRDLLIEAAFGWDVWGMWTQVVIWCVWWPAWLTGAVLLAASPFEPVK